MDRPLNLGGERGEHELLEQLKGDGGARTRSNRGRASAWVTTTRLRRRSSCETFWRIPGWYTQYTPYQAEIAQGRLEALLNFQTMVADLTGLPMANSSLLDEGTAAAEAMAMCWGTARQKKNTFFIDQRCHPANDQRRADSRDLDGDQPDHWQHGKTLTRKSRLMTTSAASSCSTPTLTAPSLITDALQQLADRLHEAKSLLVAATDLLALTLIKPPGEWGADIAIGSAQRFGVPMGGGGPHAAFMSCKDRNSSAGCPAASWASPKIRTATTPTASPSRPANNTSNGNVRRPTSARPRCCWRSWPACMRCTTDRRG